MADQDKISTLSSRNVVQLLCDFKDTQVFRKDLLCSLSGEIPPLDVLAVYLHETYVNIYFSKFDHVRTLMKKGLVVRNERCKVRYPYFVFSVRNLLPTTTYREIADQFIQYGNVDEIVTLPFYPDDHRFHHILGCERRIYIIPTRKEDIATIPDKFALKIGLSDVIVYTYCVLCEGEGHSMMDCKFAWPECDNRHIQSCSGDNSPVNSNSPIYLPHDAFQCIAVAEPNFHVDVSDVAEPNFHVDVSDVAEPNFHVDVSDVAVDVNSFGTSQISPAPPILTAFQTVSPAVSNAAVTPQHSSPSTTDSAYMSAGEESHSLFTPLKQPSTTKHQERGKAQKSGLQTLNWPVKSSRNVTKRGSKKKHKIWIHYLDTSLVIGKRNVKVVKCKYCNAELMGIVPRMVSHYLKCKTQITHNVSSNIQS